MNGRIRTGARIVEALFVEGGRVVVAGTSEEIRRSRSTGTENHDLGGRWVLPGLVDAHLHLKETVLARTGVDLHRSRTIAEMIGRVEEALPAPPGGPLFGWGWDQEELEERRFPTRDELDRLPTQRPVVLYRACHHVAVANSAALDFAGLTDGALDPPGGRLGRSEGRLNGTLWEEALTLLLPLEAAAFSSAGEAIRRFVAEAASVGLTTIAPMNAAPGEIEIVRNACRREGLPVRLRPYLRASTLAVRPRLPLRSDDGIRWAGVKIVADGSFGARTAWLTEPYSDSPGEAGWPHGDMEDLAASIGRATASELGVAIHAIGDRALERVLTALASEPTVGRPRIEHASLTPPPVIERLAELAPVLVVQPRFVPSDWWLSERLGEERARWTYAFRSLLERGLTLAGSSDSPIEPFDPWTGLAAAVASRPGRSSSERLEGETALSMYTSAAGEALGEKAIGSLEPGSYGDLVLLASGDLTGAIGAGARSVLATYHDGVSSYRRPEALG